MGERVRVSADIFKDGHDVLAAQLRWRAAKNGEWMTSAMRELGNDRWQTVIEPTDLGHHELVVEAWTDRYATWRDKVATKLAAGQEIDVQLAEGALLLESRAAERGDDERGALTGALEVLFCRSSASRGERPSRCGDECPFLRSKKVRYFLTLAPLRQLLVGAGVTR